MPVRMRLQRHGKKNKPFFHIVVADGRAPRDGKFIEKLGTYDPTKNPAEIHLNVDRACEWLKDGVQPSETVRRILSYKGVLLKRHLQIGVQKGAMTQEQAEAKFILWEETKQNKIDTKVKDIDKASEKEKANRFELEQKVKEERLVAIEARKQAEEAATSSPVEETDVPSEELPTEA